MQGNNYLKRAEWLRGVAEHSSFKTANLLRSYADDLARKARFAEMRDSVRLTGEAVAAATGRRVDELC